MKRIDNSTATVDNLFTAGNPLSATPATVLEAQWLNVLQEEVAHVIEQAGDTLDQTGVDTEQLYNAIIALIAAGASPAFIIAALTTAAPAVGDFLPFADISDSNNPKKATLDQFMRATPKTANASATFTVVGTTVTILESENIASIVRTAQGNYRFTFTSAFANANYQVATCVRDAFALNCMGTILNAGTKTATICDLFFIEPSSNLGTDPDLATVTFFGRIA